MRVEGRERMTLEENKSVVQEFYDQWNSGTIDFERPCVSYDGVHVETEIAVFLLPNEQRHVMPLDAAAGLRSFLTDRNLAVQRLDSEIKRIVDNQGGEIPLDAELSRELLLALDAMEEQGTVPGPESELRAALVDAIR